MLSPRNNMGKRNASAPTISRSKYIQPGQLGKKRGLQLGNLLNFSRNDGKTRAISEANDTPASSSTTKAKGQQKSNTTLSISRRADRPTILTDNVDMQGDNSMAPIEQTTGIDQGDNVASENASQSSLVNPNGGDNCTEKVWKPRGRNLCKKVARLQREHKLPVAFMNGRVVGENSPEFSRHLGKLIRDRNILPVRFHSWNDVDQKYKDHLWAAVTEKFSHNDMENYKESTLRHMKELWTKWRGCMHQTIKGMSLRDQLKKKPNAIEEQSDWEWLVKDHFRSSEFLARSDKNTKNRSMLSNRCLHRSGSKAYRDIAYDLGAKEGKNPDYGTIYLATHSKDKEIATVEAAEVHSKIVQVQDQNPSLTHFEVAERVHGPNKTRIHVQGFGGGVKPKDVRGPYKSKNNILDELNAQKEALKIKEDELERANKETQELKEKLERWTPAMEMLLNNPQFQELLQRGKNVDDNTNDDEGDLSSSPLASEDDIFR